MAFVNQVTSRTMLGTGEMVEYGTWTLSGGDTTGTISPATSGNGFSSGIREIRSADVETNAGTAAPAMSLIQAGTSPRSALKITSVANDAGTYRIKGYPA